jgi:hypothetical protein
VRVQPVRKAEASVATAAAGGGNRLDGVVYDEFGRTKTVTHAPATGTTGNSGVTNYVPGFETVASGQKRSTVKVTDASGRWKKTATDGLGDLREVFESKPGGGEYVTYYTYTALGKLATVRMTRNGYKSAMAAITRRCGRSRTMRTERCSRRAFRRRG